MTAAELTHPLFQRHRRDLWLMVEVHEAHVLAFSLAITREFTGESPKVYTAFTLASREKLEVLGQPYESYE